MGGGRTRDNNQKAYSANPSNYQLLEEVGYGASATVYRAIYLPSNEVVAVKCLDLDRCNSNLDDVRREAQTMSLIDHPNVISAFCSFVVDRNLWVVMPFMDEGSCLHLMKIAYPYGFEESSICTILKETLKALEYLHQHGHIHRDVKAGNILLDGNGAVKLADFGVSACLFDSGDRQLSRNSFVGTPCWMAPEVLQPGGGYNSKADIWSFGITALELAHGHAPFSKYPPMKVLLMTIQNAPPGLDYDRDRKFSKYFKQMVAMCLVKDQARRPTAEKLLKHSFFKRAKLPELSVKKLLADLPPLWNRVKAIQLKDAAQLALKKMPSAEQEALSQSEYKRGVSAWNFDIEDLKVQASLVRDDDDLTEMREEDEDPKNARCSSAKIAAIDEIQLAECREEIGVDQEVLEANRNMGKGKALENGPVTANGHDKAGREKECSRVEALASTSDDVVAAWKKTIRTRQAHSGPLVPALVASRLSSERERFSDRIDSGSRLTREAVNSDCRSTPCFSGPLILPNRASANSLSAPMKTSAGFKDFLDENSKSTFVQIKGRFSVTSANVDLRKDIALTMAPSGTSHECPLIRAASGTGDWALGSKPAVTQQQSVATGNDSMTGSFILPQLQNILEHTTIQQDLVSNLLHNIQIAGAACSSSEDGKSHQPLPCDSENITSPEAAACERERMLLIKISELQARVSSLTDELIAEKLKYMRLQQHLTPTISVNKDNGDVQN